MGRFQRPCRSAPKRSVWRAASERVYIDKSPSKEGELVNEGDVLFVIDPQFPS